MKRISTLSIVIVAASMFGITTSQFNTSNTALSELDSLIIVASQIFSAAFNDISPGFDDLYIIKTQDKEREIIIYCNATYCYKNRNSFMTS